MNGGADRVNGCACPACAYGAHVGQVPHADDVWVSTGDVVDYARWLHRRAIEVGADVRTQSGSAAAALLDELESAEPVRAAIAGAQLAAELGPERGPPVVHFGGWVRRWRPFLAGLEANWLERVGAWDAVKVHHGELLEHVRALEHGGFTVRAPDPVPRDVTPGEVLDRSTPTVLWAGLGVAALVAVALITRR